LLGSEFEKTKYARILCATCHRPMSNRLSQTRKSQFRAVSRRGHVPTRCRSKPPPLAIKVRLDESRDERVYVISWVRRNTGDQLGKEAQECYYNRISNKHTHIYTRTRAALKWEQDIEVGEISVDKCKFKIHTIKIKQCI
jgi:hypothetical protein